MNKINTTYIISGAALILILGFAWIIWPSNSKEVLQNEHENTTLTTKESIQAGNTPTIVTSFYPLQFAVEEIVGEFATVINIGEGRDPHDYRPSTQDIVTIQQADFVVLQGAGFESWSEDVAAQLTANNVPVFITTNELALKEHDDDSHEHEEEYEKITDEHEHGNYDPHTWLDPVLFSETVSHLSEALATLDPENAPTYKANAATLQTRLATLNTTYATALDNCQYQEAIISHDAFGYLADRYHLTFHAIAGLSTQDTPSATVLIELRELATKNTVGAILIEENAVADYGQTLAQETGLPTIGINPIAYLVPEGQNYLTLAEANLAALTKALNCNE